MASKKVLIKVAKELQKVLNISEPPIDMEQDAPGLTKQILEAAELIKYEADDKGPADDISASTLKVISKLQEEAGTKVEESKSEPPKAEGRPIEEPKAEKKEKVEKKAEPKTKKEKAEPKVKKEKVEKVEIVKTKFGHRETSQGGKIDTALVGAKKTGLTLEGIAEKAGCSTGRAKGHMKHLETDHGAVIEESKNKEGHSKYKIA